MFCGHPRVDVIKLSTFISFRENVLPDLHRIMSRSISARGSRRRVKWERCRRKGESRGILEVFQSTGFRWLGSKRRGFQTTEIAHTENLQASFEILKIISKDGFSCWNVLSFLYFRWVIPNYWST
jgi:hypothetical protein